MTTYLNSLTTYPNQQYNEWKNKETGTITDVEGNGMYRFIPWERKGNTTTILFPEKHHMLCCRVVACGIIGYWLTNRSTLGMKEMFDSYYNLQKQLYIEKHKHDLDSWNRNLEEEYTQKEYLTMEEVNIEISKALFDYVSDEDVITIKTVIDNYLEYARSFARPKEHDKQDVLATPQAIKLWELCRKNDFVDDNLKPKMSQQKAAILASVMADLLELCPRWAPFERLWGIKNLANKLSHAQTCKYYANTIKHYEDVLM